MPRIGIPVQFSNIRDNASPDRVQVNIANQFPQIVIFLADNGFVPILKKLAVAFVPVVEADCVSSKKSSHQAGKWYRSGAKKKMSMIGYQNPRVARGFRLRNKHCKALHNILVIFRVQEYLTTLYPPDHDVVQNTRRVKTS